MAHSAPDSAIIRIHQGTVVLPHGTCQVGMDRPYSLPCPHTSSLLEHVQQSYMRVSGFLFCFVFCLFVFVFAFFPKGNILTDQMQNSSCIFLLECLFAKAKSVFAWTSVSVII